MPESKEAAAPRWSKSILITAVVLAVVAVVIANVWLKAVADKRRQGFLWVAEATRRLEKGQTLTAADVRPVEIPPVDSSVAEKMVKQEQLAALLEGSRPLVRPVEKGERLMWTHFTSETGEAAASLVPPGYVHLTLPIDRSTSPGSQLNPGTYVVLFATMPPNTARNQVADTVVLLDRVLVVAVGGKTLYDAPDQRANYLNLTFQVTLDQAKKLLTLKSYLKEGFAVGQRNQEDTSTTSGANGLDEALKQLGLGASAGPSARPPGS